MKKFTKVSLIISAVCAVIGVLLLLIAASMGAGIHTLRQMALDGTFNTIHWHNGIFRYDFETLGSKGDTSQSFDSSDVTNITLDISAAEILFTESYENDKIIVELEDGYTSRFECSLEDDTLKIDYKWNKGTVSGNNSTILIRVPKGLAFGTMDLDIGASSLEFETEVITCRVLKMDVGAGDVDIDYAEVTDRLDITLGVGDVDISGGNFAEVKLDCGLGDIDMAGSVDGDITAHCGMGEISMDLKGNESDYNYDLSCGLGSLTVNDSSYSNIGGSRRVTNEGAEKTLKLDCGMGELDVTIYP